MSLIASLMSVAWVASLQALSGKLAQPVCECLNSPSSMTARCQKIVNATFTVQVLQQGWQSLDVLSAKYLDLPMGSQAMVREVILWGDGEPWMYAVSLFPEAMVEMTGQTLLELGNQPLGTFLFTEPGMVRGDFEFSQVDAKGIALRINMTLPGDQLLARRSLFSLRSHSLAVLEVFLPDFLQTLS